MVLEAKDTVRASEDLDAEMLDRAEHMAAGALEGALRSASSRTEVDDLAAARPVAQSTADLTPDPAASIDDAIDQITADLAAFCFEQLKRSVSSRDALDLNSDENALEDEFRVRNYIARPHQYIQYLRFRSFQ